MPISNSKYVVLALSCMYVFVIYPQSPGPEKVCIFGGDYTPWNIFLHAFFLHGGTLYYCHIICENTSQKTLMGDCVKARTLGGLQGGIGLLDNGVRSDSLATHC
jgi:hypothetical protein